MEGLNAIAIIGTMIPIIAILTGLIITLFSIYRNSKIRELAHRERMMAMEKCLEIPMAEPQKAKTQYPFAWPFTFIGTGLALIMVFFFADGDEEALGFGFVILFIGLGLFFSRFVGVKKSDNKQLDQMEKENQEIE